VIEADTSGTTPTDRLSSLLYELLDAHVDTIKLAGGLDRRMAPRRQRRRRDRLGSALLRRQQHQHQDVPRRPGHQHLPRGRQPRPPAARPLARLRPLAGTPPVIDFRYHLVTVIAIFLALAVGRVVGTTALIGAGVLIVLRPINTMLRGIAVRMSETAAEMSRAAGAVTRSSAAGTWAPATGARWSSTWASHASGTCVSAQ